MNPVAMGAIALVSLMAIACTPVFDWREVRIGDTGVSALFPCRPSVQTRTVRLVDRSVPLTLYVCSAGGASWALGSAHLDDPALVGPALAELLASAKANIAGEGHSRTVFAVDGGTPNTNAVRESVTGKLSDGRTVQEHVGVFARASWAVQVTVLGIDPPAGAMAMFFESVRVRP